MVGCRSSRLNLNKPFSGPVSTLMSSSAEFYSFSLSGCLRAVGLNAYIYINEIVTVQLLCFLPLSAGLLLKKLELSLYDIFCYTKRSTANKTYSWKMWCYKFSHTKSFKASLTSVPVSNTILSLSSSFESSSESQSSS